MPSLLSFLLLPAAGALIGWGTNLLAIRMLFRPRRPVRLLFGLTLQGVIPRRQAEMARRLAEVVEEKLVPADLLVDQFDTPAFRDHLGATLVRHALDRIDELLPHFLPGRWRELLAEQVRTAVRREVEQVLTEVLDDVKGWLRREVDLRRLVEERVQGFDLEQLEAVITGVARNELRYVELMGGVLGALIGLGQALLLSALSP